MEAILKVLTCTDGERSGSIIVRFHPSLVVTRWHVESATSDFTGLKGAGGFSVVENRGRSQASKPSRARGALGNADSLRANAGLQPLEQ